MPILTNVSLKFKGVDAFLEKVMRQKLGIANLWTISIWLKPFEDLIREKLPVLNHRTLLHLKGSSHRNEILIWADRITNVKPDVITVENWDKKGDRLRITRFNMAQKRLEWRNFSVSWDGSNLIGWNNGFQITDIHETFLGTNTLAMEDLVASGGRGVRVGAAYSGIAGAVIVPLTTWSGLLGSIAIWDSQVTGSELREAVSGTFGFDLTTNSGTYQSSANLIHWWRLGADNTDIGRDFTVTSGLINIGDDATISGINSIVTDSPS